MTGSAQRTATAGVPITLSVDVGDDGYPIPRGRPCGPPVLRAKATATRQMNVFRPESPVSQAVVKLDPGVRLGVTWVVYRGGQGTVTFDPVRVPVVKADIACPAASRPAEWQSQHEN